MNKPLLLTHNIANKGFRGIESSLPALLFYFVSVDRFTAPKFVMFHTIVRYRQM